MARTIQVHPSQLESFKLRAKELATFIHVLDGQKILSSFKRNDCLAVALGYKGHPDLIFESKKVEQNMPPSPLILNDIPGFARAVESKVGHFTKSGVIDKACRQFLEQELYRKEIETSAKGLFLFVINEINSEIGGKEGADYNYIWEKRALELAYALEILLTFFCVEKKIMINPTFIKRHLPPNVLAKLVLTDIPTEYTQPTLSILSDIFTGDNDISLLAMNNDPEYKNIRVSKYDNFGYLAMQINCGLGFTGDDNKLRRSIHSL